MIKFKKIIYTAIAACIVLTKNIIPLPAFASANGVIMDEHFEVDTVVSSPDIQQNTTTATEFTQNVNNNSISIKNKVTTTQAKENTIDYYADDYYDTSGNATLIKHEKIIYDSEEMQFIAVTTKDGSVFYVLINYSAEGDEDNVYFLNKVDDYDLYALLYQNSEENEDGNNTDSSIAAAEAADRATNGNSVSKQTSATTKTSETNETTIQSKSSSSGSNSTMYLYLAVGVVVIAGGGFVLFKFIKGKSKKKTGTDDFDGFDDEFDDITTDNEDEL